ncbi:MAG: RnfABCDGE type electron transport complex subunit G [Bacteroidales bacterium]|jgi:electron transport complex protein RnfG|nr:RnfABCDGE type electron transport complex subunit G [Bacteroidales bacterium]
MAKKGPGLFQLIFSLTSITLVAAIALAAMDSVTKAPIEAARLKKKMEAIAEVLPGFDGETTEIRFMPDDGKDSVIVYMARQDGELFGAAVETYTDIAYSGRFTIMVGFDANGIITGTSVLQMSETPGLGDKIDKSKNPVFSGQFVGKDPQNFRLKVKKDGGDVDAITAATISSRAFCDATERAYKIFMKAKEISHE